MEAPAMLPSQSPLGLGRGWRGVGDQLFFLLSVERKQSGKWGVRTVSRRARPAARPASGSLAPSLWAAGSAGQAAGPVSALHGIHRRGGKKTGSEGGKGVRVTLPNAPSSHSQCVLALGASWRLARGQWIPPEPVCGDLGLSYPGVPDVPCTIISLTTVSVCPDLRTGALRRAVRSALSSRRAESAVRLKRSRITRVCQTRRGDRGASRSSAPWPCGPPSLFREDQDWLGSGLARGRH